MQRFPGRAASRGTRHRRRRLLEPSVERLETRELLSQSQSQSLFSLLFQAPPAKNPPLSPRAVSNQLPKDVSGRILGLYELSLTRHPLYQGTVLGNTVKAPMFNPGYTGPKRPGLDVVGTKARVTTRQGLQLTGQVLGSIDPAQPAIYSFLFDSGGASASGSAQVRPGLSYDLAVTVTDGPGGSVGAVSRLDAQQQPTSTVPLPASSVRVKGHTVQVTIPPSLVPIIAPPRTRPANARYAYAFEAAVPGGQPSDVAGFAPGSIVYQAGRTGAPRR